MTVDQFLALERWVIAMLRQEPDVAEIITARTALLELLKHSSSTSAVPGAVNDLQTMLQKGMVGASATSPTQRFAIINKM